jgi:hypothetical protein
VAKAISFEAPASTNSTRLGPRPGLVHLGMEVAEIATVAADDDQVHAALVKLVELGDRLAVRAAIENRSC